MLPATAAVASACSHRTPTTLPPASGPSFVPEPGQHPLGGRPDRGRLVPELRVEPDGAMTETNTKLTAAVEAYFARPWGPSRPCRVLHTLPLR